MSAHVTPIEAFPTVTSIEAVDVTGFPNPESLFERIVLEAKKARQNTQQRVVHYLNIHVANTAFGNVALKQILQVSDLVYCDGAGIVLGAKLLGQHIPTRLTSADWFLDMLGAFAEKKCSVFLLGGEPGVPELALQAINEQVPHHSVVGLHHGYILKDAVLEDVVIAQINALNPDVLIVGFGTPLQEFWIERNRHRLQNVPVIYAIGAVMDFVSGHVSRCPRWMGDAGFEWLYRLFTEPNRLLGRYVLGNPWFLSRMVCQALYQRVLSKPLLRKQQAMTAQFSK